MLRRITIGDFDIHNLDDPSVPYSLNQDEGVTITPTQRTTTQDRSGTAGGFVPSILPGMMRLVFKGRLQSVDPQSFIFIRRALLLAASQTYDSLSRPTTMRIYLEDQTGAEYFVDAKSADAPLIDTKYNSFADFMLQYLVEDGVIYVNDPTTTGQISRPALHGVDFPWVFDPTIEFAASTGGVVSILHYGTANTWPILTFTGPSTNPSVVHQELGITMALNVTLGSSDVVTIDMKEHSILLNGATNYIPYKTADSSWFWLTPDYNTFSYSTGVSTDTGTMQIDYYPAELGI